MLTFQVAEAPKLAVAPEVSPKKKRRSAAKSPAAVVPITPENQVDATIQDHPAPGADPVTPFEDPKPLPPLKGLAKPMNPPASWDRTQAQAQSKFMPFPPVPGGSKKLALPAFCDYWNSLPVILHAHATAYFYRWNPIMKGTVIVNDFGKKTVTYPHCLKLYREHSGPITESLLLNQAGMGCGKYSIRLNDSRISNRTNADAATIVFSELDTGGRPWSDFPPDLDYSKLDMTADGNTQFIVWARSRGLIPNETQQETEDMQNAQAGVADRLTSTVERLTDKVIAQAESKPAAPAPPPAPQADGNMKAFSDLAIAALSRPAAVAHTGADPLEVVKGIAGVVQTLMPAKDTASADLAKEVVQESAKANERVFKMQQDAIQQLRDEVKAANVPPPAPPPPPPQKTELEVLKEMVEKQDLLKRLGGRGSTQEPEAEKPSGVDKWLEAAPLIAPVLSQIVGGFFQTVHFGLQTWQQISYNSALGKNGGAEQPKAPTTMEKTPEPGKPIPPQAPPPNPQVVAQQQGLKMILDMVAPLIPVLQRYLDRDPPKTGAEFAQWIIDGEGRSAYDRVRTVAESLIGLGFTVPGEAGFGQFAESAHFVFRQFPDFYKKLVPAVLNLFLKEFFDYDEIAAKQDEEVEKE